MQDGLQESRDHFRNNMSSHTGSNSPTPGSNARVIVRSSPPTYTTIRYFTPALQVHRYAPVVWGDDEEVDNDYEWDVGYYEDEGPSLLEAALAEQERRRGGGDDSDEMSWEEALLV